MALLKKIVITEGVYWVEAPEAGLYILCGCPGDCIKHLSQKGLVSLKKKNGVPYESGPNAILLSDILTQNGYVSNLSEFPAMHMFYKQGLIIPNHPNNTGDRPILIGAEDQVKAQMEYIFRGNYGLISKEEMVEANASNELADIHLSFKLKFAFGKFRPTEELIEGIVVQDGPREVRNGLFVERIALNQYRFEFHGETVEVDLNLKKGQKYQIPYNLPQVTIPRHHFSVIHTGNGDGWDPHRPCFGSIISFEKKLYLVDAGPNILQILSALGIDPNDIEGIFQTHCHDDHFAGLPSLIMKHQKRKIKLFSTGIVRHSVMKKLSALLSITEEEALSNFVPYTLEYDQWNQLGALQIKPMLSPHPVETSIFIFRSLGKRGFCSYGHYADIVALDVLRGYIDENEDAVLNEDFFQTVKSNYLIPTDLKKIDIGGGMIHGSAEDFHTDQSKKIILGHNACALSEDESEIGVNVEFGAVDILLK